MPQRIHPEASNTVNLAPPKPRLQSLPSYGTATGCPTVPPTYEPGNPTDIFVGTQDTSRNSTLTKQIESDDRDHDREESSTIPNYTNLCQCNSSVWWFNVCCGICCHSCIGKVTNWQIKGSEKSNLVWTIYVLLSLVVGVLFIFGLYLGFGEGSTTWTTMAYIMGGILGIIFILRAVSNYQMRRLFLQKQLENGNHPNDEEKWKSCLLAFFCAPCMFGQINVAQM